MLTPEEAKVLRHLRHHFTSRLADVLACLPGSSLPWLKRVLCDLEWLGYIVVYNDTDGEPLAVQTTEKGRQCFV